MLRLERLDPVNEHAGSRRQLPKSRHHIDFLLVRRPVVVGDIITTTVSFTASVIAPVVVLVHVGLLRLELKVTSVSTCIILSHT
jgi:hypothetical protein